MSNRYRKATLAGKILIQERRMARAERRRRLGQAPPRPKYVPPVVFNDAQAR